MATRDCEDFPYLFELLHWLGKEHGREQFRILARWLEVPGFAELFPTWKMRAVVVALLHLTLDEAAAGTPTVETDRWARNVIDGITSTGEDEREEVEPPPDAAIAAAVGHPAVVAIVGHRGSGKTALALRLQELLRDSAAPYGLGLPPGAAKLLPEWYGLAESLAVVPQNTVVYIPEAYRLFHARQSGATQGRLLGDLVNLSRHRRQTLIFDVQNAAHLDRNILSEADVFLVKEPGPFTEGFDRRELRQVMQGARTAYAGVGAHRRRRVVWVVAPRAGIQGRFMENLLPSFWTDAVSRMFADTAIGAGTPVTSASRSDGPQSGGVHRPGQRSDPRRLTGEVRRLRDAGHSYGEIARLKGISKTQAFRLANGRNRS